MPIRDEVLNWLNEAKADLRHAISSVGMGDFNWACFAAHQAAEKGLKSLILHILGEYPRGHDLVKLSRKVNEYISFDEGKLSRLSSYYTQSRYPNAGIERPSEEITKDQAEEAIETATGVIDEVEKAIRDP